MDKREIVARTRAALAPEFPFELVWSCYRAPKNPVVAASRVSVTHAHLPRSPRVSERMLSHDALARRIVSVCFSGRGSRLHGSRARPHFLLTEFSIRGTGIGAFIGPCHVQTEHLVDWEDRLASDRIEARSMIHFIGEFFGASLHEGVLDSAAFHGARV